MDPTFSGEGDRDGAARGQGFVAGGKPAARFSRIGAALGGGFLRRSGVRAPGRRDRPPRRVGQLRARAPGPAQPGRGRGGGDRIAPRAAGHAYETPVFGIRPGVTELHWDRWPRIDDAIAGYQVFSALRADGVIPGHLRFQVGLPFPASALNAFKGDFAADYPVAARAFEDLAGRELARLTAVTPPADLAIQWDMAYETQDLEGVLAWTSEGAWERFAGPVTRLTRQIPEETLVGYP